MFLPFDFVDGGFGVGLQCAEDGAVELRERVRGGEGIVGRFPIRSEEFSEEVSSFLFQFGKSKVGCGFEFGVGLGQPPLLL